MPTAFMDLLSPGIMQAICRTFVHSIWQGILAAALSGLILLATRRSSASLRYNLLSVVFVLFLITTAITLAVQWPSKTETIAPTVQSTGELVLIMPGIKEEIKTPGLTMAGSIISFCNRNAGPLVAIWMLIFLYKCSRIAVGLHELRRLRKSSSLLPPEEWINKMQLLKEAMGLRSAVQLLESTLVKVPMAIGFLKPLILVPAGMFTQLSPAQVETILLHELAHIKRRDYLMNLLQNFAGCVFFFNPALLWISALLREEREACCDDKVMAHAGDKKTYVEALVSFQEYTLQHELALGAGGKKMFLFHRVRRLLAGENKELGGPEKLLLLLGVIAITAFTFMPRPNPNATGLLARQNKKPADKMQELLPTLLIDTIPVKKQDAAKPVFQAIYIDRETDSFDIKITSSDQHGNKYLIQKKNGKEPEFYINGEQKPFEGVHKFENLELNYRMNSSLEPVRELAEQKQALRIDTTVQTEARILTMQLAMIEKKKQVLAETKLALKTSTELQERIFLNQKINYLNRVKETLQEKLIEEQRINLKGFREFDTIPATMRVDMKLAPMSAIAETVKVNVKSPINSGDGSLHRFVMDLVTEGVVKNSTDVKVIVMDGNKLEVNNVVQPVSIHARLKAKYEVKCPFKAIINMDDMPAERGKE